MVVILDYGMGNLRSISNKLQRAGVESRISADPTVIEGARRLVLPGVGSFSAGMKNLHRLGLIPVLERKVLEEKTPVLGICLGFQLFTTRSEEGDIAGLSWIAAETKRFQVEGTELKVPHVGWNETHIQKKSPLFENIPSRERFYFTHSFHVCCEDRSDVVATTWYGVEFASAIQRDNIYGTQFHPEKSHHHGFQVLRNFVEHS